MHVIKSWFWPGVITTALLTALAGWFLAGAVDQQLTDTVNAALESQNAWASAEVDGRDLSPQGHCSLGRGAGRSAEDFRRKPSVFVPFENAGNTSAPGGAILLCCHQIR